MDNVQIISYIKKHINELEREKKDREKSAESGAEYWKVQMHLEIHACNKAIEELYRILDFIDNGYNN